MFPKPTRQIKPRKFIKNGKKISQWSYARNRLKQKFAELGIVRCEFRYDGCLIDAFLGFAHSKKRRHIKGDEIYEVALSCQNCHDILEYTPDMTQRVLDAIKSR